jgi:hypothetical protein
MTVRSHHLSRHERTTPPDDHVLLARRLAKGYSTLRVCFASTYVQRSVYDRLATEDRDHLMRFIWDSAGNPFLSAIRGMLFEEHAHRRLASGELFRVRRLDGPADGSGDGAERVTFGKLDTLMVQGVDGIRSGYYCRPQAKNFASVDAVVAPSSLFQMTVGEKHPVKHDGLAKLQPKLASSGPVRLYFVVPPDRWASFGQQNYVTQKGVLAWVWVAWCGCSERLRALCRQGDEGRRCMDPRTRAAVCAGAGAQARR